MNRLFVRIRPNFNTITRNAHHWWPDSEYFKQFRGPLIYPNEEQARWKKPPFSGKKQPREMTVKNMFINFGPAHPAAHGLLRMVLELDGETVRTLDPHIGFLHRGTEKHMEYRPYNQNLHYLDRLDYVSTMCNELSYCLAVEKLLNVDIPRRAKYIRTMMCELTRLLNHMLNTAGTLLDLGAITPLFWCFEEREKIFEFCERCSGARMHTGYFRPGGVMQDMPIGLLDDIYDFLSKFGEKLDEMEDVATENRLFCQRTQGIGKVSSEDALNMGFTGVMLRASGVKWDIRKAKPYDAYDEMDFDVVVGHNGDIYDRFLVRMEEMRQSMRIIEQCINCMPEGEIKIDDHKICPPTRAKMKTGMEDLIHHFKFFSQGYSVPPGSTYVGTEHPKGEFGVYLVSDGTNKPYRCKLRPASYAHLQGIKWVCRNEFLADVVAMVASIDVVFGDMDR